MKKILIVEDHEPLRVAYKTIMTAEGFEAYDAGDGEEALKLAEKIQPDIILLDLIMPKMDGVQFLTLYDVPNKHPQVKVIVFSNSSSPSQIENALKLGAKRYLVKAVIPPRDLIKLVKEEAAKA